MMFNSNYFVFYTQNAEIKNDFEIIYNWKVYKRIRKSHQQIFFWDLAWKNEFNK